ncbi:MAG TPA: GxxExxY protein [Terriglobales bacterium]|jgi:GxxExxY protein|nr:GxxExxY protein [Terriglobales bacterium]
MQVNDLTHAIIGAAMKVHTALGPGLLENAYKVCLMHELRSSGIKLRTEVELPVVYNGVRVELGYRLDMLVEDLVIVELKCVESFTPLHKGQLLSYLKLSNKNVGLLINFQTAHLKDGIQRLVYGRGWDRPDYSASVASVAKN